MITEGIRQFYVTGATQLRDLLPEHHSKSIYEG